MKLVDLNTHWQTKTVFDLSPEEFDKAMQEWEQEWLKSKRQIAPTPEWYGAMLERLLTR